MRRRELLAGLGSVSVLAGAGYVALNGVPSIDEDGATTEGSDGPDPITIETVDAPGSEAGQVTVPDSDQATFVDLFGTWCPPCIEQMPALAEAHGRVGDEVLFLSVTNERISNEELVEWWDEHDGSWLLGLDPTAELTARYLAGGYPTAVAIDSTGEVQWSDSGVKTADELVTGIEQALEA